MHSKPADACSSRDHPERAVRVQRRLVRVRVPRVRDDRGPRAVAAAARAREARGRRAPRALRAGNVLEQILRVRAHSLQRGAHTSNLQPLLPLHCACAISALCSPIYDCPPIQYEYMHTCALCTMHCVLQLLRKEPGQRLGREDNDGARAIRAHSWFKSVNWRRFEAGMAEPLFVPDVRFTPLPDRPHTTHTPSRLSLSFFFLFLSLLSPSFSRLF